VKIILEVKGLSKNYINNIGHEQPVLNDINLSVKQGEFVALMGPSGSGKSTLLYSLSGMEPLTSGKVFFHGNSLAGLSEKELAAIRLSEIGFVFQQVFLLKHLSLLENILLPGYLAKKSIASNVKAYALKLMERLDVLSIAQNDLTQASGGQLQRVAICRALINSPRLIIGDEPTGALNSKSANEVMKILNDVNTDGTTIILATHDVKVAAKAERILYMLDGKIVGEYQLEKYKWSDDADRMREKRLAKWLAEMGF